MVEIAAAIGYDHSRQPSQCILMVCTQLHKTPFLLEGSVSEFM